MKMIKKIIMSGLAVFFLMGLCACGKVTVKINDGGVMTEMEVSSSKTVEQALEEAEITLNEGDEVPFPQTICSNIIYHFFILLCNRLIIVFLYHTFYIFGNVIA